MVKYWFPKPKLRVQLSLLLYNKQVNKIKLKYKFILCYYNPHKKLELGYQLLD